MAAASQEDFNKNRLIENEMDNIAASVKIQMSLS